MTKYIVLALCMVFVFVPLQAVTLMYSSYLGGSAFDQANGIAIDGAGHVYVAGYTGSSNFPIKVGSFDSTINGSNDIFVSKLDTLASGSASLIYSTFIGGYSDDIANSIAVDNTGNAYITGYTHSTTYPLTTSAFDSVLNNFEDVIFTKLNASGSSLLYSTLLGGDNDYERGFGITVDTSQTAYITGVTKSSTFQVTTNAYNTTFAGVYDVFVSKINTLASGTASLAYSSYLGGNSDDGGIGITVDSAQQVYVAGYTLSSNFPVTTTAFIKIAPGSYNCFMFKLDTLTPGTTGLRYSTYLGGSDYDFGNAVAIDTAGIAYIAGYTKSNSFPVTTTAYSTTFKGNLQDAFISKINTLGSGSSSLVYSTFFGGENDDSITSIAIDTQGNAFITGYTYSTIAFPFTSDAIQTTYQGIISKIFISKLQTLTSGTAALIYSSFFGGNGISQANGIAVDTGNTIYIAGFTSSTTFQTTSNAFDTTFNSSNDAFVSKINLSPGLPISDWMIYSNGKPEIIPLNRDIHRFEE